MGKTSTKKKKPTYLPVKERVTKPLPVMTLNVLSESLSRSIKTTDRLFKEADELLNSKKKDNVAMALGKSLAGLQLASDDMKITRNMIRRMLADKWKGK